jgi:hypothetical protein
MPIVKRRLDICGREKAWEYVVETAGRQYQVSARQVGKSEPEFRCSCGVCMEEKSLEELMRAEFFSPPCSHIAEAQRDLNIARQAAAQMLP